jgi:hypothetical protein
MDEPKVNGFRRSNYSRDDIMAADISADDETSSLVSLKCLIHDVYLEDTIGKALLPCE